MKAKSKLFRMLVLLAVAAGLSFDAAAQATQLWCDGTVSRLWIDASGNAYVFASWRGDYVRVCNVNQDLGSVTPTICLTWVALLRSAVQRTASTTIYYTGAALPAKCPEMLTYTSAPVPSYVMLVN